MVAERILTGLVELVAEGAVRTAELLRDLVGHVVVRGEAHLVLALRVEDPARHADLQTGARRRRRQRLDRDRFRRRQASVEQISRTGHDAIARRTALDPQAHRLDLVGAQRRLRIERHRPHRRVPFAGERLGGEVDPQQTGAGLTGEHARPALHRRRLGGHVDEIVEAPRRRADRARQRPAPPRDTRRWCSRGARRSPPGSARRCCRSCRSRRPPRRCRRSACSPSQPRAALLLRLGLLSAIVPDASVSPPASDGTAYTTRRPFV